MNDFGRGIVVIDAEIGFVAEFLGGMLAALGQKGVEFAVDMRMDILQRYHAGLHHIGGKFPLQPHHVAALDPADAQVGLEIRQLAQVETLRQRRAFLRVRFDGFFPDFVGGQPLNR